MRIKMISEIFDETSKMKIKQDRIDNLRKYADECMRYIVQGAYHPGVVWLLPTGEPPYTPAPIRDTYGILHREFKKLYIFCKGGSDSLTQSKREKLFIDLLSKLHPDDAKLLCAVKDKTINYPYLTYSLFQEAFSEWLPPQKENDMDLFKNESEKEQEKIEVVDESTNKFKGTKIYNNGEINKMCIPGQEPKGFVLGKLK